MAEEPSEASVSSISIEFEDYVEPRVAREKQIVLKKNREIN